MKEGNKYLIYNGSLYPADQALFNAQQASFQYGEGVFETMRLMGDRIPLLKKHLQRLQRGMKILNLSLSVSLTASYIMKQIERLQENNRVGQGGGIVRLMVFRDDSASLRPKGPAGYILQLFGYASEQWTLNEKGWSLTNYTSQPKAPGSLSQFKLNNYLVSVLGQQHAEAQKVDDCLLFNTEERPIETTIANLFVVKDNTLYTSPVEEGCVDGIMRQQVLTMHAVKLTPLSVSFLQSADESLLTNAAKGIRWVYQYNNVKYHKGFAQQLTDQLNQELLPA